MYKPLCMVVVGWSGDQKGGSQYGGGGMVWGSEMGASMVVVGWSGDQKRWEPVNKRNYLCMYIQTSCGGEINRA